MESHHLSWCAWTVCYKSNSYAASVKLMSLMGATLGRDAEARELPMSKENWLFKSKVEGALREVLKHDVAPQADGWARFLYASISPLQKTLCCRGRATLRWDGTMVSNWDFECSMHSTRLPFEVPKIFGLDLRRFLPRLVCSIPKNCSRIYISTVGQDWLWLQRVRKNLWEHFLKKN